MRKVIDTLPDIAGEHTLVVTETIAQADKIGEALELPVYHSKKKSDKTLEAFRTGEVPILVTVKMLHEGFNAPTLDTVVIVSSALTERHIVQVLGRGLRFYPGKIVMFHIYVAEGTTDEKLIGLAEGIMEGSEDTDESLEFKWKRGERFSLSSHTGRIFTTIKGMRYWFKKTGMESEIFKHKRHGGKFRIFENEVLVKVGNQIVSIGEIDGLTPLPQANNPDNPMIDFLTSLYSR